MCVFNLNKLMSYSMGFAKELLGYKVYYQWLYFFWLKNLIMLWKINFLVNRVLMLALNMFMFFDLYFILKNPFYPRQRRAKWYYLLTSLIVLSFGMFTVYSVYFKQTGVNLLDFEPDYTIYVFTLKAYLIITTFITTIFALLIIFRLQKPGTSKDLRRKVLSRHILYYFLCMLIIVNYAFDLY